MTKVPACDWRDCERLTFEEVKRIREGGELPSTRDLDADGLRRAGYLAEFVGLLLPSLSSCNAPEVSSRRLVEWASDVRSMLLRAVGPSEGWPVLAAVAGTRPKPLGSLDCVARTWMVSPPLSRDRYLSEEPTLASSPAPP